MISIFVLFITAFFTTQPSERSKHTQTQTQPAMAAPRQVVRAWVVWVRDIHPGWRLLGAKMDHRSWHHTSCGPDLLPWSGNKQKKKREAQCAAAFPPRIIIDRWPFYAMKDMACCLFMLFLLIQPGGARVDCHHLRPSFCGPMTLIAYLPSTFEFSPSYARLSSPWFRADWFSHSKARGSSVSCMRWQDFQAQAVSPDVFCSAPPRLKCQSCHVWLRLGEVAEEEGENGQTAFGRWLREKAAFINESRHVYVYVHACSQLMMEQMVSVPSERTIRDVSSSFVQITRVLFLVHVPSLRPPF